MPFPLPATALRGFLGPTLLGPALLGPALLGLGLSASAALADPEDFKDKLPETILEMKQVKLDLDGGDLIAFYEGPAGRSTIRITPAPEADPDGAWDMGKLPLRGVTPSAQRQLMVMMDANLSNGTKGLGEGYELSELKFDSLTMGDVSATCALPLRKQPGEAADLLYMAWRICTAQNGSDMITISTLAPTEAAQLGQLRPVQVAYTGEVLMRLLDPKF